MAKKRPPGTKLAGKRRRPVEVRTSPVVSPPVELYLPARPDFPVVCVGASAGGLEAFTQLLRALPSDTGMAFVLVQHLDPRHDSILTALLAKVSSMPVLQVENDMAVAPNHVYVIPPNSDMGISGGVLRLTPRSESRGLHMPIDFFMRRLAKDQRGRAIGVILSGTASDGALGVAAIKAEGGITFAQDEKSAEYSGMPRAAAGSGCVDFVQSPEQIALELTRIARHPYVTDTEPAPAADGDGEPDEAVDKIFRMLYAATGVDFAYYKPNSIRRRISRRLVLHKVDSAESYLAYLQKNPGELDALHNDILITVTSFFRDPEVFDALRDTVLPAIIKAQPAGASIRVWVPGCASGEEAYSVAICLLEALGNQASRNPPQVFATDISEPAIEKARAGQYPESISQDVSHERLRRFFVKADGGYQINKSVRDMCIFARQNLAQDPPFSKLDLISCRNVLIYMGPALQKRVMTIFHYALKLGRFLLLGSSETMSAHTNLFSLLDRKNKIHVKRSVPSRMHIDVEMAGVVVERPPKPERKAAGEPWRGLDVQQEADRLALARWAPSGVIINNNMEILQFRGRTSPYLEPAPGEASLNILKMAREGLLFDLRTGIHEAKTTGHPVRREGVRVRNDDQTLKLNLEIIPVHGAAKERCFLIAFESVPPPHPPAAAKRRPAATKRGRAEERAEQREVVTLRRDLGETRRHLQAIIEEQEATNEELRSANEEILSSNEELQSTNEELETAKEELQSSNEELTTVNDELQNRNGELNLLNNDLNNLLSSIRIPVVMLSGDLRIRRFTQAAERLLNLIPTDVGRPISDIKPRLDLPGFEEVLLNVIDTVSVREMEVQDRDGRWYLVVVRPYRTADNKIDGVVIALLDIDALKRGQAQAATRLEEAQDWRILSERAAGMTMTVDTDGAVLWVSEEAKRSIDDYFDAADLPRVRDCLEQVRRSGEPIALDQLTVEPLKEEGRVVALSLRFNRNAR